MITFCLFISPLPLFSSLFLSAVTCSGTSPQTSVNFRVPAEAEGAEEEPTVSLQEARAESIRCVKIRRKQKRKKWPTVCLRFDREDGEQSLWEHKATTLNCWRPLHVHASTLERKEDNF